MHLLKIVHKIYRKIFAVYQQSTVLELKLSLHKQTIPINRKIKTAHCSQIVSFSKMPFFVEINAKTIQCFSGARKPFQNKPTINDAEDIVECMFQSQCNYISEKGNFLQNPYLFRSNDIAKSTVSSNRMIFNSRRVICCLFSVFK